MKPMVAASANPERAVMSRFRPCVTSGRSPLVVVRLPGELTGSGTTCPTPAPHDPVVAAEPCEGYTPELRWFPGSAATGVAHGLSAVSARIPTIHSHGHLSRHPSR